MTELRLTQVSKRYDEKSERPALWPMDLCVKSGRMAVLVGPSGCGKSTTLRIVAGLEEPTTGEVHIGDRNVTRLGPAARDIAMVFQSYALYPHMTVFENLAFALKLRKVAAADIRERVTAVARALEIEPLLSRRPGALSGGQRQRVAMGRAMVREPKVFLFDEPLSNLDAKLRSEMRREIARIHQQTRTTCLYVTHDQVEAMTLADDIVVMKDGHVLQVGSPLDIYDCPQNRFVAGFFGTPSMCFVDAERHTEAGQAVARGRGFSLPLPAPVEGSQKLCIGIRPEAIALAEAPGASPIRGQVQSREILGAEVLIHITSDAGPLTVRTPERHGAQVGDHITAWLDPARAHVFDAATEERL
ncbi:MAG TPA: sn-glycerol-3-phosphate ABC transporter ATP-binding protein UgpC [Kofleriaceae bacterium]|nr:sn-glycerol-3-phosphate ABC transporter ATP-binding protein UgpC [Kofleriaceae bacterium]